jgi:hypothetical protein
MPSTDMDSQSMETCFEALELGQRQLTKVSNKLEQALSEFISRLLPVKQEPANGAVENPRVSTPASASVADKPWKMKPSLLTKFDRDCAKGHAFMNLCRLYIGLCPDEFPDDEKNIFWVLSFFKKDRVATWADHTLCWAECHSCQRHAMWDTFIKDYISHFCPPNERMTALIKLEMKQYYQNKCNIEEYIDEFEELINMSQYKDSLAIVLKFCHGLNATIQDKIAELGTNQPSNEKLEQWYVMAWLFDQNHIANEAFQTVQNKLHAPSMAVNNLRSVFPQMLVSQFSALTSSILQNRPVTNTRVESTPQRLGNTPQACYCCGSFDHLSPQCKIKFDVWAMTSDEREDILEQLLVVKDVVREEVEESGSPEDVCEGSTDFVPHSG